MRFILPVVALFFLGFLGFSSADLRFASSPKETRFAVRNRDGSVAFSTTLALYNEPATFGYAGLRAQRQNNYDNFLRSNIDNEQDNRNFNQEAGKDMLPFRTNEATPLDETKQIPESIALNVEPGKEYVLPLRWNNPHASEMELNIWIQGNTIVVPIKKPVCAGEGYQDGVISFIVPTDFNDLITKVQGFNGCTKLGDCTLQMYAHSVEPRTYAAGTPIIVSGFNPAKEPKAANNNAVQPPTVDPGADISKQPNLVCLSSVDPTSNIANAVPRWARHVSDVYNHAYQNSDYSPYSGQQHEAISKTMQAAGILRMVNGNRGELGQSILTQQQKNTLANLRNTADNVVKTYEAMTNKIINQILKNGAKTTATVAGSTTGAQKLNNCFRCKEAASVSANRLETNTYVPSFKIENAAQADAARQLIQNTQPALKNLINTQGVVNIYVQSLNAMAKQYADLQAKYGLGYQPARVKSGPGTMADPVQFKKINAAGQNDGGKYAATQAKAKLAAEGNGPIYPGAGTTTKNLNAGEEGGVQFFGIDEEAGENNILDLDLNSVLTTFSADASAQLSANADDDPAKQNDYHDVADDAEGLPITKTATAEELAAANQQSSSSSSSSSGGMSTGMVAGIAGAGGALFAGLIAAGIIIKNKKQAETQQTNTRVFTDARV